MLDFTLLMTCDRPWKRGGAADRGTGVACRVNISMIPTFREPRGSSQVTCRRIADLKRNWNWRSCGKEEETGNKLWQARLAFAVSLATWQWGWWVAFIASFSEFAGEDRPNSGRAAAASTKHDLHSLPHSASRRLLPLSLRDNATLSPFLHGSRRIMFRTGRHCDALTWNEADNLASMKGSHQALRLQSRHPWWPATLSQHRVAPSSACSIQEPGMESR